MTRSACFALAIAIAAAVPTAADVLVIQHTSLRRVRADDRLGVGRRHDITPLLLQEQPGGALAAPANFAALTLGTDVTFTWEASPGATSYQLEAGTAPGLSDAFVGDVGNVTLLQASGPPGSYYVRVRAKAGAATSAPSNELVIHLGTAVPCGPPAAPSGLTFSKDGTLLTLSWPASAGATSYRVRAGTAPGAADAFDGVLGAAGVQFNLAGVPPGTYFVRVLAQNPCGVSGPSNEVTIAVP